MIELEQYTAAFLVTSPDAPALSEEEAARLQDAHLARLAELHEAGHLLAAGSLGDPGGELRGLSLLRVGVEHARALEEADPAKQAGIFHVRVMPWFVPAGAADFSPTRFPRSVADVAGRGRL